MRWLAVLVLLGCLLGGCGAELPDCAPEQVIAAQTCDATTVTCQGPDRAPVVGCVMHLLHAPGQPYEAECVAACGEAGR